MDSAVAPAGTRVVASQRRLFPLILMDVLNLSSSDPNLAEILAWNDDGTSFRVLSRQGLEEIVMPQYFGLPSSKSGRASSSIKYASFTRKLNRWGFRRITAKGPDLGNFHHYQFRRDEPELIALMECTKHRYGTTDTAADASFGTTFTTSAASVVDSSIGGTAAASSLISAWGSIYPGTGTYGALGYMRTHGPPTYTSTSEGALMHGRNIPNAAGVVATGTHHAISGQAHACIYSNHHPSQDAISQHQPAMAFAVAHHGNAVGIPVSNTLPPNSNVFGAGGYGVTSTHGHNITGAGNQPPRPPTTTMGYQQAAAGLGSDQQLSIQVAHHAPPNTNYYTKLEIMALARRDRAIVQYRNAAGASLPHQSKQEEGKKEDEDQQEQQKKESSSDTADVNRKTEEVQGDGTNPEDL